MDSNEELEKAYQTSLENWANALEEGLLDKNSHIGRVVSLAMALARKLNLDAEQTADLRRGMLVHDIGTTALPDSLLLKPGTYSPEEYEFVKQHVIYGHEMLHPLRSFNGTLAIVRHHHEHWDGSGYPDGLIGDKIPYLARLAALIEVWDGVTSDRPNRPAWSHAQARAYIQEQAGLLFDPDLVPPFLALVDERASTA